MVAQADNPGVPLQDETVKLWMGFLDRRLAKTAVALSGDEEVHYDLRFANPASGEGRIPFGQALVDIAEDHYVFQSIAEGGDLPADGGGPIDVGWLF